MQVQTLLQSYGVQSVVVAGAQLPIPSHVGAFVWVWPVQLCVPHVVELPGKTQAPVLSQPVAPQVLSVVLQAAVQQLPVPLMPHNLDVHASFSVHEPVAIAVVQAPPLQTNPVAQSLLEAQVVLQLEESSVQAKWLGHPTGVAAEQLPAPLQALFVSMPMRQTFGAHVMLPG
jgi:hypothetical protein